MSPKSRRAGRRTSSGRGMYSRRGSAYQGPRSRAWQDVVVIEAGGNPARQVVGGVEVGVGQQLDARGLRDELRPPLRVESESVPGIELAVFRAPPGQAGPVPVGHHRDRHLRQRQPK